MVSKPGAVKVRNLRADPRAMLALGDAEADFDVGLLEARAELLPEPTPLDLPAGYLAKYEQRIEALGLTPAQFARDLLAGGPARAGEGAGLARTHDAAIRPGGRPAGRRDRVPHPSVSRATGSASGSASRWPRDSRGGPDLARRGVAI